jgi:hypothetical protein
MQSVPITTNVVSLNPTQAIQHYVIKFVSDYSTGRWFSPGTPFSSTNKTDRHDITEILLKMVFNTINLNLKTVDVVVYCKLGNKFVHEKVR